MSARRAPIGSWPLSHTDHVASRGPTVRIPRIAGSLLTAEDMSNG